MSVSCHLHRHLSGVRALDFSSVNKNYANSAVNLWWNAHTAAVAADETCEAKLNHGLFSLRDQLNVNIKEFVFLLVRFRLYSREPFAEWWGTIFLLSVFLQLILYIRMTKSKNNYVILFFFIIAVQYLSYSYFIHIPDSTIIICLQLPAKANNNNLWISKSHHLAMSHCPFWHHQGLISNSPALALIGSACSRTYLKWMLHDGIFQLAPSIFLSTN